jgi:hypothetical protein
MKMKKSILFVMALAAAGMVAASPALPSKAQIAGFKKLAKMSVLHVETSLKKIEANGPAADAAVMRREVTAPAAALAKEWQVKGLSDAVMFSYSACPNALADVQGYSDEALRPPKYHLSDMAQQKLRYLKEELEDCRSLQSDAPQFSFAK